MQVQVAGKRVHGVAEVLVISGADEGREQVRVQTQVGTPRAQVGILAVVVVVAVVVAAVGDGVGHPAGISESCNFKQNKFSQYSHRAHPSR